MLNRTNRLWKVVLGLLTVCCLLSLCGCVPPGGEHGRLPTVSEESISPSESGSPLESGTASEESNPASTESNPAASDDPTELEPSPVGLFVVENGETHTVVDQNGQVIVPATTAEPDIICDQATGEPRLIRLSRPADRKYAIENEYGMIYLYEHALYDAQGNQIFDFALETESLWVSYVCGNFAVAVYRSEEYAAHLCRMDTWETAVEFVDGLAAVGDRMLVHGYGSSAGYRLLDDKGNIVKDLSEYILVSPLRTANADGEEVTVLHAERYVSNPQGIGYDILDTDGNRIWKSDGADVITWTNDCLLEKSTDGWTVRDIFTGEPLFFSEQNIETVVGDMAIVNTLAGDYLVNFDGEKLTEIYDNIDLRGNFLIADWSDTTEDASSHTVEDAPSKIPMKTVFDLDGEKILEQPVDGFFMVADENLFCHQIFSENGDTLTQVYNQNGELVAEAEDNNIDFLYYTCGSYSNYPPDYLAVRHGRLWDYLGTDGRPILTDLKRFYGGNGYVSLVNKGFKTGLMDRNGNWLYSETCYTAGDD